MKWKQMSQPQRMRVILNWNSGIDMTSHSVGCVTRYHQKNVEKATPRCNLHFLI